MKKVLFIFSIISLGLLSSCSKDDNNAFTETLPSDTQKVLLSIANLNEINNNLTKATSAEESAVKKVIYSVYKTGAGITAGNEEFVLIDSVSVNSTPISNISLDLQPGTYMIAVFASGRTNAKIGIIEEGGKKTLKNSYIGIGMTSPTEFYGTVNVEVVKDPINATVTLQRIVGKVEIVIKDLNTVAAGITSVTPIMKTFTTSNNWLDIAPMNMRMTSINASIFDLANTNPSPFDQLKLNRDMFSAHNENNPIVFYCLQTATNFSAENFKYTTPYLYLHLNPTNDNPSNKILITPKLLVYPNKITRYTGSIVGENSQGFDLSVVDEWDNNPETIIIDKLI